MEAIAMRLKIFSLLDILAITMIVGVLIGLLLPGNDYDATHRYPASAVAGINLSKVAGDYYRGNGRGMNWSLSILPDGRYSFVWSACVGIIHREAGQAREVEGHLVLTPENPNAKRIPRDLLPIHWDERSYLIRPDDLPKLCEAIIAGDEPRNGVHGLYYVANQGRADGLPDVPEKWLAYLRARLTIGKIIEVSQGGMVKVALGSKQGLRLDDLLKLQGESGELRVATIEEDSCLAIAPSPFEGRDSLKPGRNVIFARPDISPPDQ